MVKFWHDWFVTIIEKLKCSRTVDKQEKEEEEQEEEEREKNEDEYKIKKEEEIEETFA